MRASLLVLFLCLLSITVHAKTSISGRVTGIDNKPISFAHVFLTYPSDNTPLKSVEVAKNGQYKIEIDANGLWMLHFTGIFHHEYTVAIYCNENKDLKLDVNLNTYSYVTKFDRAKIIGNFNDWSIAKEISLKKDSDNQYSAIIKTSLDTVYYKLINVRTGGEVEGTDADGYVPSGVDVEGIKGYKSFQLTKNGQVKISVNPAKLIHSDQRASFKLFPENTFENKFAKAYATLEDTRDKFKSLLYEHLAQFRFGFKFDFTPYIDSIKNLITAEPDSLVRQVLQLSYFELIYMSTISHHVEIAVSRKTVSTITPNSVVWSLNPASLYEALNQASFNEPKRKNYIQEVLNTNPMNRTIEILLSKEIDRKFHSLKYSEIPYYLTILVNQYGDSPEAKNYRKTYYRYLLENGTTASKFSIKDLLDSKKEITNESFKGEYYLINFWSIFSSKSIDEIKTLKEAYERYNSKLKIVSVSVDTSSAQVLECLNSKITLPWEKAITPNGISSEVCKNFVVSSLPTSILIDPKGIIVANGWELYGSNLMKTLKDFLK